MSYHVYVVELSPEAARRSDSKRRIRDGGAAYYVGSTGLSPAARLSQHLRGKRGGNHVVRRWGRRIVRVDAYATRQAAESAESALAHRLARQGNVVYRG